jgi:hypothetical protein
MRMGWYYYTPPFIIDLWMSLIRKFSYKYYLSNIYIFLWLVDGVRASLLASGSDSVSWANSRPGRIGNVRSTEIWEARHIK